eukprot:TRINITY_DN2453_c0_g1_i2.p1 TRINITY_DN2453_c0_g1~~TRINITY_DN2453_c0_g1_i2.p1  ORF type:complete len:279 (+),score=32.63 TRINITY_DN2453_c0_g1_i2:47-838(+)
MKMIAATIAVVSAAVHQTSATVVYGLRPYQITGIDEKDTADVLGEVFFLFGDRIAQSQKCAANPSGFFCKCEVTCEDNVYTSYNISTPFGLDHQYGACNPQGDLKHPDYTCYKGDPFYPGSAQVNKRYNSTAEGCVPYQPNPPYDPSCNWKYKTSKHIGGTWYSTPAAGDCSTHPSNCSWKVESTIKVVNESCVNGPLLSYVTKNADGCIQKCPQPTNSTSTCYLDCFFEQIWATPAAKFEKLFMDTFDSCPGRQPYNPSIAQ